MKHVDMPAPEHEEEETRAPAGARHSGVRARSREDEVPCTSFEEVCQRYRLYLQAAILTRLPRDWSAVDDVSQHVWITLDRLIREERRVPHPIRPVLATLVDKELCNHVRGVKRRREDDAPDSQVPTSKPGPEQLLDAAEQRLLSRRRVRAIFAQMDGEQVKLLQLAHFEEMEPKDIATLLGKEAGAVRVALHRARARFGALYRIHLQSRSKR